MHNKVLQQLGMALPLTFALTLGFKNSNLAFAQLTPDNTLGVESSIVTPQQLRDLIQGGAIRGNALFHSFDEFNVEDNGSVFFDLQNNTNILNIFTRITGSNASNILGTLGVLRDALNSDVLGSANLFLLNPNGITFGANANLQLNGSFFATTADSFDFDNFSFSASGEEAPPPLLTVSIPRFLSFRDNPGTITNQSVVEAPNGDDTETTGLQVPQGQTLGLIGGEILFSNGGSATARDGRIEVGAVGESGSVSVTSTANGYVLGYEGIETFENITLDQESRISTTSEDGTTEEGRSDIKLQGRDITLTNGSRVQSNNPGSPNPGEIVINSSSKLVIEEGSQIESQVQASLDDIESIDNRIGTSIVINTEELLIQSRGNITALVGRDRAGNGGNVTINSTDLVRLTSIPTEDDGQNSGRIFVQASRDSIGDAGDLTINTTQFVMEGGSLVAANTRGAGNGGNLTVNATESVQITGESQDGETASFLFAQAQREATGNGGNLTINTSQLLLEGGGAISVRTRGDGNGGNLTVNATESVRMSGRSIVNGFASGFFVNSQGSSTSTGNGGSITINTPQLTIQNEAFINARTQTSGDGGNIEVNASESILIEGNDSRILANARRTNATGNAGKITINTPQLTIRDEGSIQASTAGIGNGGNIKINVDDTILIEGEGSGIFSRALEDATGNAGTITIDPQQVTVRDGGIISVESLGAGEAGTLTIISDNLTLDNGRITATTASVDGGNIILDIADLLLLRRGNGDALISATAGVGGNGGEGNGGNLNIDTTFLVAFPNENSDITANASQGRGGNVNITATSIYGIEFEEIATDLNDITASSDFGVSGTVTLNTPETQTNQEQIEQPEEVVDGSDIVSQSACYDFGGDSQLANTGRGGVPQIPGFIIRNSVVDVELVDEVLPAPPPQAIKPHHRTAVTFLDSEGEEFKPAMGAVLLPNGMVEFVDYNPAEVYRDMYAAAGCNRLSNN